MKNNFLLIGIDGGATKVSGCQVIVNEKDNSFLLGQEHAKRSYSEIPGYVQNFKPIELAIQLAEKEAAEINPTDDEQQQAAVYIEACARVVEELVEKSNQRKLLIGLGMPGLKTNDKRGIAMIANGPRMINFTDQLEKRLAIRDIKFIQPIQKLGSDADYCGIGENYSKDGLFHDVENAYYLGGGTGAADAMKLDGKLMPFDEIKEWVAKSWEMQNEAGRSLEQFASAGGMQSIYAEFAGKSIAYLNEANIYPLQIAEMAGNGDSVAKKTFTLIAENLALLLFERITTLFAGWQDLFSFINPNRTPLQKYHPRHGYLFQRIVIGQRLGELFDSKTGLIILKKPVFNKLELLIQQSTILDNLAKNHYQNLDGIIQVSSLRAAPALGAGIDAFMSMKN